jgi:hypothetical protein
MIPSVLRNLDDSPHNINDRLLQKSRAFEAQATAVHCINGHSTPFTVARARVLTDQMPLPVISIV